MKLKYIVIAVDGQELLFPLPEFVMHVWGLEAVRQIKQGIPARWIKPYLDAKCIAAGFIMDGICYGRSESLNLDSRGAVDTAMFERGCV